jgi:hypothetical protein
MSDARWPAMMTKETAAEYCDMSPSQFDDQCPAQPIDQGWRGLRWKRSALDKWIEALPEKPRRRKMRLDETAAAAPDAPPAALTKEERQAAALARM